MKDTKAFLNTKRKTAHYRPVEERLQDYKDVVVHRLHEDNLDQAIRCMDCGTPFCHWACPVGNYIPEWNDLVATGNWERAYALLKSQNNFPEFTSRICPALCESSCVLGINEDPITVRENELAIIEKAFAEGYEKPNPPKKRSNKKVAVVGSGPAGLAAADMLNQAGHNVTVFEKEDKVGGLLRYGIPDFKLEKNIIDRRIQIFEQEGIVFKTNVNVGVDLSAKKMLKQFDAICLAGGSEQPRDLNIEGRDLEGVHFAMDYLRQSNKKVAGIDIDQDIIDAKDKKVVVIGGGDTGSDCIGTANRQGAASVVQLEVMPKPTEDRPEHQPWPYFPTLLKNTSSHEEGCERQWSVLTKKFVGRNGKLEKLLCVKVAFEGRNMKELPGTEFEIPVNMAILAIGFVHPIHEGLLNDLGVEFDERGNVKTDEQNQTSIPKVFSAGDMRRGQSLVVWAIDEGRKTAQEMIEYLYGPSIRRTRNSTL